MFKFENRLDELKHRVLTGVIKLAIEDKVTNEELAKLPYEIITGNTPTYRCCVYKERAIVEERAKLAAGFSKVTEDSEKNNKDSEQVIYVIEAACDKCPINRFNVTDSCRNCVAHKCKEACNFGAIQYVAGRAYINQEICKECGMCKKACPYDAIAEVMRPCKKACPTGALEINEDTKISEIEEAKCVNCGACMDACPFGAISDKSLVVPVTKSLVNKEEVYAIVAPAITGQIERNVKYGQVKNAIKKLGFTDMIEAACGADAVTVHETLEFAERMEKGDKYMTNSCCPGFHSYIEKMFPDQKDRISGTVSPMVAAGRYIKKEHPNAKVVFIGPCTAKKAEAAKPNLKDAVDYVLTFQELFALFEAFNINPAECEDEVVDDASIFGRGFGASGGLTNAIQSFVKDKGLEVEFKPIKVSGGAEIKKTMTMAKVGKIAGNFIEGMMCEGGCINGAGKVVPSMKAKGMFIKNNADTDKKSVLANESLDEFKDINLEK